MSVDESCMIEDESCKTINGLGRLWMSLGGCVSCGAVDELCML